MDRIDTQPGADRWRLLEADQAKPFRPIGGGGGHVNEVGGGDEFAAGKLRYFLRSAGEQTGTSLSSSKCVQWRQRPRGRRQPDRRIDAFHRQVDRVERGLNVDGNFRMPVGEAGQSRHQPAPGKAGGAAQRQAALRAASGQPRRRVGDRFDGLADRPRIGDAGLGQFQLAAAAAKQLDPEPILQVLHGMADRARGDVELLGRVLETTVPRGGLEYAHRAQWRKLEAHSLHLSGGGDGLKVSAYAGNLGTRFPTRRCAATATVSGECRTSRRGEGLRSISTATSAPPSCR